MAAARTERLDMDMSEGMALPKVLCVPRGIHITDVVPFDPSDVALSGTSCHRVKAIPR